MNFSDEWRSLFPVASVFPSPCLLPSPSPSHGPLLFFPSSPPLSLPSLPSPSRSPSPSSSNLLASLRLRDSTLLLLFPTGDNSDHLAFVHLPSPATKPSVQIHGFKHSRHRILHLSAAAAEADDPLVEGFVLAATLYSANWFTVRSNVSDVSVVPAAKQGFDSAIVHGCWSPHFASECAVLLESGELCWFNLSSRRGGRIRIRLGNEDGLGAWLACDYGAQPWMVVVVSSKAVFLVDLRFGGGGEYRVLAKVAMPGVFDTELLVRRNDRYLAFCKAPFNDFHMSVVTKRQLILIDARRPLVPVLTWDHWLESPSHVAMFKLSELRPSKEYEWASESGFAILVGSLRSNEFNLFCYGLKERGCPANSPLYAWELPSRFSLIGRRSNNGDEPWKEVFSGKDSACNSNLQRMKDPIAGYCVLPNDFSVIEPGFDGFVLIRLLSSGKLEMQKYRASWNSSDEKSCNEAQGVSTARGSPVCFKGQGEQFPTRYDYLKLSHLCEHLNGNLRNSLAKHDPRSSEEPGQIIVSSDVLELVQDLKNSTPSISDLTSDASTPTSIFEIASRNILSSLPLDLVAMAFSKYSYIFTCSTDSSFELLEVPTCLSSNTLRSFLFAKPSSRGGKWTSKVLPGDGLVGPVLPIPVLLALKEWDEDIEGFSSQGGTLDDNSVSRQCRMVLEKVFPEISIADMTNCNGWSASQGLNDERPFFVYERQQIQSRSMVNATKIKKEEQELDDSVSQTSSAPYKDDRFTTFICGVSDKTSSISEHEPATSNIFDFSPVRLDFDSPSLDVQSEEQKIYKWMKKQFTTWQSNFKPYQDFCASFKIPRTI